VGRGVKGGGGGIREEGGGYLSFPSSVTQYCSYFSFLWVHASVLDQTSHKYNVMREIKLRK